MDTSVSAIFIPLSQVHLGKYAICSLPSGKEFHRFVFMEDYLLERRIQGLQACQLDLDIAEDHGADHLKCSHGTCNREIRPSNMNS